MKKIFIKSSISPRRRIYPPACKPYGLEAEPKARGLHLEPRVNYLATFEMGRLLQ